jgi:hypothetical protein
MTSATTCALDSFLNVAALITISRSHAGQAILPVSPPIYLRLLVTAEPVSQATADTAAAAALAAARAGVLRAEPAPGASAG